MDSQVTLGSMTLTRAQAEKAGVTMEQRKARSRRIAALLKAAGRENSADYRLHRAFADSR